METRSTKEKRAGPAGGEFNGPKVNMGSFCPIQMMPRTFEAVVRADNSKTMLPNPISWRGMVSITIFLAFLVMVVLLCIAISAGLEERHRPR